MRLFPSTSAVSVLICVLCLGAAGCSQTATIHRYAAPSLEAEVVGSDVEVLLVTDQSGEVYEVPVQTITEIDHPGNVTGLVGGYMLLTGIAILAAEPGEDAGSGAELMRTAGWVYTGLGTWLGVYGLSNWLDSTTDAAEAEREIGKRLVPGLEEPVRRSFRQPE